MQTLYKQEGEAAGLDAREMELFPEPDGSRICPRRLAFGLLCGLSFVAIGYFIPHVFASKPVQTACVFGGEPASKIIQKRWPE